MNNILDKIQRSSEFSRNYYISQKIAIERCSPHPRQTQPMMLEFISVKSARKTKLCKQRPSINIQKQFARMKYCQKLVNTLHSQLFSFSSTSQYVFPFFIITSEAKAIPETNSMSFISAINARSMNEANKCMCSIFRGHLNFLRPIWDKLKVMIRDFKDQILKHVS